MSRPAITAFRRHLPALLLAAGIVGGLITLLYQSAEARDVAGETAGLVFTFFSTPFILEATVAAIGLMAVLAYNQRRREKETDEWVKMEVMTAPDTKASVD